MHMQIAVGLQRLSHQVYYFETTPAWPYDPVRQARVCDAEYAAPYLARVAESIKLGGQDYEQHSRTARAIAEEYFKAETVLAKVLTDLGC